MRAVADGSLAASGRRVLRPAGEVHDEVFERVRARLLDSGSALTAATVAEMWRAESGVAGDATVLAALSRLRAELTGAGPLEPLLANPDLTDVLVNGPDEVWADTGTGLVRTPVRFPDERAVRALAVRLAQRAGRRLDDASPWVDARLPGGIRLHAVLAPVSPAGTVLSLRLARRQAFDLADLLARGTLTEPLADAVRAVIGARLAFLVTGGTGSGKTTLLTTLLGLVGADERLVLVEDSGELAPVHPHVVRLEARPPNAEGAGEVTVRDLVRQAMRMRPDRLVVGEVRGGEVEDLLAALNTGHAGGAGTVHANSPADVPARVEALAMAAGLDRDAAHSQLAAALQVVIHIERVRADTLGGPSPRRHVTGVSVLERRADGLVRVLPAVDRAGPVAGPGRERLDDLLHRAGALTC